MRVGLLSLLLIALNGCAHYTTVTTTPLAESLTLREAYQFKVPLDGGAYTPMTGYMSFKTFLTYTLPAGIYPAKFANAEGYFFPAPGKVKASNGFIPVISNGGIYWRKDAKRPDHIYTTFGSGPGGALVAAPFLPDQIHVNPPPKSL